MPLQCVLNGYAVCNNGIAFAEPGYRKTFSVFPAANLHTVWFPENVQLSFMNNIDMIHGSHTFPAGERSPVALYNDLYYDCQIKTILIALSVSRAGYCPSAPFAA